MQALVYENGKCTKVLDVQVNHLHLAIEHAQRITICNLSSTFCVHVTDDTTLYYSGMHEHTVNSLYTSLLAPYSHVGESDDKDLFVDNVQIVLDNFAKRLQDFLNP